MYFYSKEVCHITGTSVVKVPFIELYYYLYYLRHPLGDASFEKDRKTASGTPKIEEHER